MWKHVLTLWNSSSVCKLNWWESETNIGGISNYFLFVLSLICENYSWFKILYCSDSLLKLNRMSDIVSLYHQIHFMFVASAYYCWHTAGLGFLTSLVFIFLVGIFVSSWVGSTIFWVGEWFIKKMPFVRHIYSASKQVSTAISPGILPYTNIFMTHWHYHQPHWTNELTS